MSDSMDSRKFERKTLFDVPLPMRRTQTQRDTSSSEDHREHVPPEGPGVVKFSLLTKRGNKQQVPFMLLYSRNNMLTYATDQRH
jgi:regulator of nonsense transcripts 2